MANPEHLAILKQGVDKWDGWRRESAKLLPDLSGADLRQADLRGKNFSGVSLQGFSASFEADLRAANFSDADLSVANFEKANLLGADLRRASLRGAQFMVANLRSANLTGANLSRAGLIAGNLCGANLSGANLTKADFFEARLNAADLRSAELNLTDLRASDLRLANLKGADLSWANLSGADLGGTDLSSAISSETVFANLDLSVAKGLETVVHRAPSTIGIRTIYKSGGKIPEAFLRGCGVPEEFIAFAQSISRNPIEFYSCFISYAHAAARPNRQAPTPFGQTRNRAWREGGCNLRSGHAPSLWNCVRKPRY